MSPTVSCVAAVIAEKATSRTYFSHLVRRTSSEAEALMSPARATSTNRSDPRARRPGLAARRRRPAPGCFGRRRAPRSRTGCRPLRPRRAGRRRPRRSAASLSMPFCSEITIVSAPMSGASRRAASSVSYDFTRNSTTSTGPMLDGSSVAWTSTVERSPSGVTIVRPCSRIASRWAPRAIRWTSAPAIASREPEVRTDAARAHDRDAKGGHAKRSLAHAPTRFRSSCRKD